MKYKFVFIICLIISFTLMVGCSNDSDKVKGSNSQAKSNSVLVCNYSDKSSNLKYDVTTYLTYSENKKEFTSGNAIFNAVIPKQYKNIDFCKQINKVIGDSYKNCDFSVDGNNATLSFDFNLDKLEKNKDYNFKKDMSVSDAKSMLEKEKDGIVCEIK